MAQHSAQSAVAMQMLRDQPASIRMLVVSQLMGELIVQSAGPKGRFIGSMNDVTRLPFERVSILAIGGEVQNGIEIKVLLKEIADRLTPEGHGNSYLEDVSADNALNRL